MKKLVNTVRDGLYFYRIIGWQNKIGGARIIGYTLFGHFLSGQFFGFFFLPVFLNTLAVLGNFMLCSVINDYFDWKIRGDRNFLSSKIGRGGLSERQILIFCLLPVSFIVPIFFLTLFFGANIATTFLFIIFIFLFNFYSIPPIRLKDRKILGYTISPFVASLLFFQSYCLFRGPDLDIFLLGFIIFLFHCYVEMFHILDDSLRGGEIEKISADSAKRIMKLFPFISLIFSLAFSLYNHIFLITSIFSLIRMWSQRKFKSENITKIRKNLLLPQWSLCEFVIYAILGISGLI